MVVVVVHRGMVLLQLGPRTSSVLADIDSRSGRHIDFLFGDRTPHFRLDDLAGVDLIILGNPVFIAVIPPDVQKTMISKVMI